MVLALSQHACNSTLPPRFLLLKLLFQALLFKALPCGTLSLQLVHTQRLQCSFCLVMAHFLLRGYNILPKKELHWSPLGKPEWLPISCYGLLEILDRLVIMEPAAVATKDLGVFPRLRCKGLSALQGDTGEE